MLASIVWNVDPEIVAIGPLVLRWYGLMWAMGFLVGYSIEEKVYAREGLPEEKMEKLFLSMLIGTILGARL